MNSSDVTTSSSSNYVTATTTISWLTAFANVLETVMIWFAAVTVPILGTLALICNAIILIAMPYAKSVNPKAKLTYMSIAFFESFPLVTYQFLIAFIGMVLHTFNGTNYFFIERVSSTACRINRFLLVRRPSGFQ